ncbi:uncharacterized protein LOC119776302 [Cyprinodon tularosa]|uniref:uncharacterized protein LOC119776302 n=1 Tax=Cyprinodon tularosa TaxID=77115 RepID=UPI0018E1EEFE|nr:uncharacterized protein LOC119776302 [Cyprinodon tularosa]
MVRVCSYPGCFNQMKRKCGITHSVTFHKLALRDPERLKLWLIALRKDLRTANVDSLRVCSEHFSADDFRTCKGRALLKSTAVPMVSQLRTEGISQHPAAAVNETANIETSFDGVPHSTPVKPKQPGDRPEHSHARLQLVLTSPETTKERTCPSTSGSYHAFPPTWLSQTDMQAQMAEERLEEGLDVSMTSIVVPLYPKDTSFALPSSTSTSTPTSEETEDLRTWDERKWLVDESKLFQLFKTCHQCGTEIIQKNVQISGSRIKRLWECLNQHSDEWSSCPDVRGMPENNLLVAASTLFTGATYTTIADWAGLLNLQIPNNTTYYKIQSSYLIPVIDMVYNEQHKAIMEQLLHKQYTLKKGVHVSGDGRSDSPGFSAKYNTYSFMEDTTKEIILFQLVQKDNRDLQPWIKSICNHLWYACSTCGGDPDDLIRKWKALLHHICGVHRREEDGQEIKCVHADLTSEEQRRKRWLRRDSYAFKALTAIALDKGLMKDLREA